MNQSKRWVALLTASLILLLLQACRGHLPEAPRVSPCKVKLQYRDKGAGCLCSDPDGTKATFIKLAECDKYFAMSPVDAQASEQYVYQLEQKILGGCK